LKAYYYYYIQRSPPPSSKYLPEKKTVKFGENNTFLQTFKKKGFSHVDAMLLLIKKRRSFYY